MREDNMTETSRLAAFETLREFLEEDGWYPQHLTGTQTFRMGFAGTSGQTTCAARIEPGLEVFVFYVVAPVRVPEPQRHAVAEFLTRGNYGLRIGNFEMDYTDGEVRYKSALNFEGSELTPGLLRNAIYPAVQTMDRYLPGLMSVVYGGATPADAILAIEG